MNNDTAEVELEVPFHDVDALNVVWHGHYYKYFEIARTALLRRFDCDIEVQLRNNEVWPVVESKCRYIKPLRYGMKIKVKAKIVECDYRLLISYEITDSSANTHIATGMTVQVPVEWSSGKACFSSFNTFLKSNEEVKS